jgi:hypothetical protein
LSSLRRLLPLVPRLVVLVSLAGLPACGGSDSPSGPDPVRPVAYGLDFTIIPMVSNGTVVDFHWTGSGASAYKLEIGSSSGASDVGTFETSVPTTTFTWNNVPIGTFYARVRARQGATLGGSSNEVVVGSIDARQMIDAMLFGHGPLAVAGNSGRTLSTGYWKDRMLGWQPGASFAVILGESVSTAFTAATEKTVQQIAPATRGAVHAGILGRHADPLPPPNPGEVTISVVSLQELKDFCRCEKCVGCARTFYLGSFARRAQILVTANAQVAAPAHELGHVIGLAHIISAAGVRPPFTMGFTTDGQYAPSAQIDVLDPATVRMLETVYDAGLTPGSTGSEFEASGLVPSASVASFDAPAPSSPGYVVTREGLETVVLKPLCEERRE